MKIFQILDGKVHWYCNTCQSIEETRQTYAPTVLFVEAPDYVFEGWGFDPTGVGDARFIKPEPPEGWAYDDETGTFYPTDPDIIDQMGSTTTEVLTADEIIDALTGEE